MMGFFRSLAGWVRLRCTSADPGALLSELEKNAITICNVTPVDELTLEFSVQARLWNKLRIMAERRGENIVVIGHTGLYWPLLSAFSRPFLLCGMLLLLAVCSILPGRILFVSVEGNSRISARRILEAAEEAGLEFFTVRRDIRSEQIKNQLLDMVPELKWAGVNTYGSRAVITVRERDDTEERDEAFPVRHVVAARDGIITSCTVTAGSGACTVGQAVKQGDILISGYTDCGLTILAGAADGRVLAETNRSLTVLTPGICRARTSISREVVRYSLILGKNRINFYKGSGISGGTCVKMSTEYVLRLPGGFELPVSLVKERILYPELVSSSVDDPSQILESFASEYLRAHMAAGSVIQKEEVLLESDALWILEGQYACIEDIGIVVDEKIGEFHGKTDGTDRERGSGG